MESQLTIVGNNQRFSVLQMTNKVKASPPISDQPNEEFVSHCCMKWYVLGGLALLYYFLHILSLQYYSSARMATCVARYYVTLISLISAQNLRRIKRIKSSN